LAIIRPGAGVAFEADDILLHRLCLEKRLARKAFPATIPIWARRDEVSRLDGLGFAAQRGNDRIARGRS
jgi:hypothetical protein